MDVKLFFLRDRVMVDGRAVINEQNIDKVRPDLDSGIFIIRKVDENKYIVRMNAKLESELHHYIKRNSKNTHNILYKKLNNREPMVIQGVIDRLSSYFKEPKWNQAEWLHVLKYGIFNSYTHDSSSVMLDYLVYDGKLEYESYGTYSVSENFMKKILDKDTIYISWISNYLKCNEKEVIDMFMERHGYERTGKRYERRKNKEIGFLL